MKKFAVAALATVLGIGSMVGSSAFAGDTTTTEDTAPIYDEVIYGADKSTWSPFAECDSLEDAEIIAGFDMSTPDVIDGYADIQYAAMKDDLLQIEFTADENKWICIRKAVGNEDISGDYNIYNQSQEIAVDGKTVTIKGNDGIVSLAAWTDGEYSYSVGVYLNDNGMTVDAMSNIIAQIR